LKEPYTDEEIAAILDGALQLDGGSHGYAKQPKTFRLLLELMLATGLRVGDAVAFDPRAISKGDALWIYTYRPQKQKRTDKPKLLEAYLTEDLKNRIDECKWLSTRGPFWYGVGTNPTALAQAVYERMQGIGTRAGIADCRPHRLRDTFAVGALLRGMQLENVCATSWTFQRKGYRGILRKVDRQPEAAAREDRRRIADVFLSMVRIGLTFQHGIVDCLRATQNCCRLGTDKCLRFSRIADSAIE